MNSEELTRHYYSKLRGLPDIKKVALFSVAEYAIILGRSLETSLASLLYAFLIYFLLLSFIFLRNIKTALFLGDITGIPYLLLSFFSISLFAFGFTFPILSLSMFVRYGEKKSVIISLLVSLLPVVFFPRDAVIYLVYILLVSLLYYTYIWSINKQGKKIVGIPSLKVLRPFMKAIMEKDFLPLDRFFENGGEQKDLNVALVRIGDKYFIIPQVHFGIFGRQGSARFPYVMEEMESNSIVFHGPGSHEINLVTLEETKRVANLIKKEMEHGNGWHNAKFKGIGFYSLGHFQVTTLKFSNFSVSFLERPSYGIDDLPGNLWDSIRETKNFVVDSHNSFLVRDFDKVEIRELNEFLLSGKEGEDRELYVGYSEGKVPCNCEGYCNRRFRVVTIGDGEKRIGIVYFYANNAQPETRQCVIKAGEGLLDRTIMVTPDDHSCAGSSMTTTYLPAMTCSNMDEIVRDAIKRSLSSMRKVDDASYKLLEVKAKVIGKIISSMLDGLEKVGKFASRTFWIPLLIPYSVFILILVISNGLIKF